MFFWEQAACRAFGTASECIIVSFHSPSKYRGLRCFIGPSCFNSTNEWMEWPRHAAISSQLTLLQVCELVNRHWT
jgi:hypothetical protein